MENTNKNKNRQNSRLREAGLWEKIKGKKLNVNVNNRINKCTASAPPKS